jgi:polysaccharide export outer membrane protein
MLLALLALSLLVPDASAGRGDRKEPPNVSELAVPDVAAQPFVFGPGDKIGIKVFRHPDLDGEVQVAPDGTITLPLAGRVVVAGKTYTDLVTELEAAFKQYYTDASVAVNVVDVNNQKIFVVGEVAQPAVLQITGEMTVLEALTRTGGINPDARTDNILLVRGGLETPQLFTVDVDRLLVGDLSQNVQLQRMDIVVVPAKTIVNVERFFRHVQGILGPLVSATQVYRNVAISQQGPVIEDTPGGN